MDKKNLPKLMGILNVTPDSCYDNGRYFEFKESVQRALRIAEEGADIIDVGGESTRPGAIPVDEQEELRRVIPVIKEISASIPLPISIDTRKWRVAAAAIEAGASIINDVTGLSDPEMRHLAASTKVEVCMMHMQGNPQTMQVNPHYEKGVVRFLLHWFEERIELLLKEGISPKKIYLDPGIGFGKTVADNLEIIHNLAEFRKLGFPLLLGLSRKSFMGKINHKSYAELLPETLAIHTIACLQGVDILRIHDVHENRSVLNLLQAYFDQQRSIPNVFQKLEF